MLDKMAETIVHLIINEIFPHFGSENCNKVVKKTLEEHPPCMHKLL